MHNQRLKLLIDLIFPIECLGCKKPGQCLCKKCLNSISDFSYNNKLLSQAIHCFKYEFIKDLAQPLAKLLIKKINYYGLDFKNYDLITFIPLHWRRLHWRGFNQSQLLAQELGVYLNKPTEKLLQKTKPTKPQINLSQKQRQINVKNCFACIAPKKTANKKIILIDDVKTTGATLLQAQKALKKANAKQIFPLTLSQT